MPLNPLIAKDFKKLQIASKVKNIGTGEFISLRGAKLVPYKDMDLSRLDHLAKIIRGLIFTTVENAQSGHPGGSSSKVEQFLALTLGGSLAFDPADPKHPGRDRVIWSAGHCTPLLYGGQALYYEALRRTGRQFSEAVVNCVLPEELLRFRRIDGPSGHAESIYPFCDYSTGPSGHGFCAAGGMALSHRASGLPTRVWVFMGDAESEEGMTYEARNVLVSAGAENLVVSLDYNHFGIDGPIEEVMSVPYLNYWLGLGWNVIEADGHNVNELMYAYALAAKMKNKRPTVVIALTRKGRAYGKLENSAASHGSPIAHDEYVALMRKLGFKIDGAEKAVAADMEKVLDYLSETDCDFIEKRMAENAKNLEPESVLVDRMKRLLKNRPLANPREIKRPKQMPSKLVFRPGQKVDLRQAAERWFEWLMKQTAFFYAGAGDLSGSTGTMAAEKVYGLINAKNPSGRGLRFGIAEQNMAMMSMGLTQDILPGGFRPISVFGTYGVFTAMYGHAMHLALVANAINPNTAGFFVALATHDGPETGEDGPTHQGMYWHALFENYPGLKVYKPTDANEVIEMLFSALAKGEPIVLALPRGAMPVLSRGHGIPEANAAAQGAYVYKNYAGNGRKKITLALSGPTMLKNASLSFAELEPIFDIKIVVVTAPKLFNELYKTNREQARQIIADEEKNSLVTLHNGSMNFLDDALLTESAKKRRIGANTYLKSGRADEVIRFAGLDVESIAERIISMFK
jgi:transketolase